MRAVTTLISGCAGRITPRCLPSFCRAVQGSCGGSDHTCIRTLFGRAILASAGYVGYACRGRRLSGSVTLVVLGDVVALKRGLAGNVGRPGVTVTRGRHLLYRTVLRVRVSRPRCSSTGSAVHLDCNVIGSCASATNRCSCCAAVPDLLSGVTRDSGVSRCGMRPRMGTLFRRNGFNVCGSGRDNRVRLYFVSGGSVANKGSNDPVFGNGNRLVNLTFSNG